MLRFVMSVRMECALLMSLNFSAASGLSGFLSGWYLRARLASNHVFQLLEQPVPEFPVAIVHVLRVVHALMVPEELQQNLLLAERPPEGTRFHVAEVRCRGLWSIPCPQP
uniref:Putative secreted protein n=1 Tax=Ixodes ricinus TaxID=34613 RepID=A0A6B0UJ17_IXORI